MIKVVFVLIVLLLSAIFAYLVLSNKKGEETQENKDDLKSNETKKQEDEDTSSTANAQPIETEPPEEEEDPGTCETTGDWAMSGECQADGTAIFTQAYKESKPGACPSTEKARVKPCCYQKGDWADITALKATVFKTQQQTTVNCADNIKMREYTCEYVGPWTKVGACTSDGNQAYYRVNVNSIKPTTKTEKCCYLTSDWKTDGWCEEHKPGFQKYVKTYKGKCTEDEVIKWEPCRKCKKKKVPYSTQCCTSCCSIFAGCKRSWKPCTKTKWEVTDHGLGTGAC
jgi:hypothetical protein